MTAHGDKSKQQGNSQWISDFQQLGDICRTLQENISSIPKAQLIMAKSLSC